MQKLLLSVTALGVLGLVLYQPGTVNVVLENDAVETSVVTMHTSPSSLSAARDFTAKQPSRYAVSREASEDGNRISVVNNSFHTDAALFGSDQAPYHGQSAGSRPSNDLLRLLIAQTTPFSEEEVDQIKDPVAFMHKVNGILTGNVYESEYLQNPRAYQPMDFVGGDLSTMAFRHDNGRVFARLHMQGYTGDEVLVKWYNPQTGQVLAFDKYQIVPENSMHPLWLEHKQPWQSGQYNVEVYSADESLRLLSAAVYQVSDS